MNTTSDALHSHSHSHACTHQTNHLNMYDTRSIECGAKDQDTCSTTSESMTLTIRRRRLFQRRACIISVMAAFALGLALGVFVPLFGMSAALFGTTDLLASTTTSNASQVVAAPLVYDDPSSPTAGSSPSSHFPTIYEVQHARSSRPRSRADTSPPPNAVSFLADDKVPAKTVFQNAFYLEENKDADTMTVKKLDANDGTIKEFVVQRTADGLFRKSAEVRLSKPTPSEEMRLPRGGGGGGSSVEFLPHDADEDPLRIIEKDIYWGETVERALPIGFSAHQTDNWNEYLRNGVVVKLEVGCGRMQNRMVTFQDGTKACARYRQNTDQIQGELFSFYLGQLLNITNMAPSGASLVDVSSNTWQLAAGDIKLAEWKSAKPVVLTQWLPDLESAGIPQPFQPLERHLNKLDVKNITGAAFKENRSTPANNQEVLLRLVELAQWSDLIIFDYLIANLDRVVNNLYNYQWNADIMAAPAHNLARQKDTQLLVFLDNESGLLHGYRLLKKYEAYHGLLLDNLCVFRRPTIDALRQLRTIGVGQRLQRVFESTTHSTVRDVLPPLPEKSIKILNDRIDRVLGQVQKCHELFAGR